MPLQINYTPPDLTLSIQGDIDHHSARALMLAIDGEVARKMPKNLILDLKGVTFMDSSGIALLLRARRQCLELGAALTVSAVPAQAKKVFAAAGLDKLVKLC